MKILQVIDTLNIGGAERMCVNISNLLTSKSVENSILVTRELGPLSKQVESDKIDLISKKNGFDLLGFYRFIKVIKAKRPTVIHAHSTSIYWAFGAKVFFPGIKLIWHDHLGSRPNQNNFLLNFIQKKIDIVLAINEFNYNWFLEHSKRDKSNVFFIPNFPYLRDLNRKKDKSIDEVCIVHVANLHDPKDHFTHVKAIAELIKNDSLKQKIAVRFIGNFSDLNYKISVEKLIKQLNLVNTITLVGPLEDLTEELNNADIGVLSSTSEGLPVALLEYGLAGLAVVATNVGQCSLVLGNGEFGYIVDTADYKEISKKIHSLIVNNDERMNLGESFRINTESNYGKEMFYNHYSKIIA